MPLLVQPCAVFSSYHIYRSGNMYDGEWLDNKRHGEGTMYWKSRNEVYSGQWEQGVQHGYGKHTWILETNDDSQVCVFT